MKNVIYALRHPETFEIRYIGFAKNSEKRYKEHYYPNRLKADTYKIRWLKSILPLKAEMIVLEQYNTEQELPEAEIKMIAYMKSIGAKLTNGTDGGEGVVGAIRSESWRAKISAHRKGNDPSKETRKKMSEARKLRPNPSKETRDKMSKAQKGRKHSQDTLNIMSLAQKNRFANKPSERIGKTWKLIDGKRVWMAKNE